MPRTYRQHAHGARGTTALDRTRATRKKKPYKVVMEVVTQEKKKLLSRTTHTADAPRGYTFVPLGNPDLTEYCKEKCRKQNLPVYIVSAKPKRRSPPSRNSTGPDSAKAMIDTQRIGHHVPHEVIDEACDVLGYIIRNGVFHKRSRNRHETRLERILHNHGQRMGLQGRPATETETRDQIRSAILEVFPKIPTADLNAIVRHAFEEGTKRVGNAMDIPLARRVQLAVGAYIRHQYTDYDNILRTGISWLEAREKAKIGTYSKLKEWWDEEDNDELEETFREIIVLDEDDDETDDDDADDQHSETGEESSYATSEREQSLEIISSRATARELEQDDLADIPRPDVQTMIRKSRRHILLAAPSHIPSVRTSHRVQQQSRVHQEPLAPNRLSQPSRAGYAYDTAHRRPLELGQEAVVRQTVTSRAAPSQYIRDREGRLYHLEPIDPTTSRAPQVEYASSSRSGTRQLRNEPVRAPSQVKPLDHDDIGRSAPLPLSPQSSGGGDVVLPSIEREFQVPPTPKRMDSALQPRHGQNPVSMRHPTTTRYQAQPLGRVSYPAPSHDVRDGPRDYVYEDAIARDEREISQNPRRLGLQTGPPLGSQVQRRSKPSRTFIDLTSSTRDHQNRIIPGPYDDPLNDQFRPRMQPGRHVIDLTSSPLAPLSRDGHSAFGPATSYDAARSNSRAYIAQSAREYPVYVSEPRTTDRHTYTRHEYGESRVPLPGSHDVNGGSQTRSGLHYRPHDLR